MSGEGPSRAANSAPSGGSEQRPSASVGAYARGPLSHLTILDLSRVLAGPWCTQLLADLGATVIKIERPGSGDDTRAWGPPFLKDAQGRDTSEAAYYLACNRGKLSVAVDFTQPEGQRIVRESGAAGRCAGRELQGRRPRQIRPRLRERGCGESAPRLCVDHRLRTGRPLRRARRLRLHHPGHERIHERHRRARRPAGRRPAEGGCGDHRPHDRHVRRGGDPGRAPASRPHGRRPTARPRAASIPPWR